jgi:hypothetical protein
MLCAVPVVAVRNQPAQYFLEKTSQRTVRSSGASIRGCWVITESTQAVSCAHPAVAFSAPSVYAKLSQSANGKPRSANDGVPDRSCQGLRPVPFRR